MTKISKKQRITRAAGIGAAGFAVALAIVVSEPNLRADWSFLRCATGGAFLAGLIFAGAFGREGSLGWFYAGLGFGSATILGAVFAVMLLPIDGAFNAMGVFGGLARLPEAGMFGPVYVASMMAEHLGVATVWAVALAGIHLVSQRVTSFPIPLETSP